MAAERIAGEWVRVWIPVGCGLFIAALLGSAIAVPQLLWLHFFQSLIYVVVCLLAQRNHAAAFGAGFTIAAFWNSNEWFGPHLIQAGAVEFCRLLQTGRVDRPDTLMVFLGSLAHLILIIGCVAAFRQLHPGPKEWRRLLAGALLVIAYFAVIVATLLPR
jgi:hypothetical protein